MFAFFPEKKKHRGSKQDDDDDSTSEDSSASSSDGDESVVDIRTQNNSRKMSLRSHRGGHHSNNSIRSPAIKNASLGSSPSSSSRKKTSKSLSLSSSSILSLPKTTSSLRSVNLNDDEPPPAPNKSPNKKKIVKSAAPADDAAPAAAAERKPDTFLKSLEPRKTATLLSHSRKKESKDVVKEMEASSAVLQSDFLKQSGVPTPQQSKRATKLINKAEREKDKGSGWFNMPATELTDERKRDLQLLRMRHVLDPKRNYKPNDKKSALPKYFQVGTIVEDATDFYSSRVPKKQRKRTIADELLADSNFNEKVRGKYDEIVGEQRKEGRMKSIKRRRQAEAKAAKKPRK